MDWMDFNAENLPESGVYWVVFDKYKPSISVNEYGQAEFGMDGAIERSMSLAELIVYVDGSYTFNTISSTFFGRMQSNMMVKALAKFESPTVPQRYHLSNNTRRAVSSITEKAS